MNRRYIILLIFIIIVTTLQYYLKLGIIAQWGSLHEPKGTLHAKWPIFIIQYLSLSKSVFFLIILFLKIMYKVLDIITAFKTMLFQPILPALYLLYPSPSSLKSIILWNIVFLKGIIHFKMKFQIFLLEIL